MQLCQGIRKTIRATALLAVGLTVAALGQTVQDTETTVGGLVTSNALTNSVTVVSPVPTWQAAPRNSHSTEWIRISRNSGRIWTNRYTEVGNWLNAPNPDTGAWVRSRPHFIVTATGLESRGSGQLCSAQQLRGRDGADCEASGEGYCKRRAGKGGDEV